MYTDSAVTCAEISNCNFFLNQENDSVQFSRSVGSDSATPWSAACQATPVHQQLLELTQTYVHRVSDAIQPSHPLSYPSTPVLNLSQQESLFE